MSSAAAVELKKIWAAEANPIKWWDDCARNRDRYERKSRLQLIHIRADYLAEKHLSSYIVAYNNSLRGYGSKAMLVKCAHSRCYLATNNRNWIANPPFSGIYSDHL